MELNAQGRDSEALEAAREAVRQALVNLEAVDSPAGTMTVVLGPGWPGILLHEAIGHGLEGDFNRKGSSAFSGRVGERVEYASSTLQEWIDAEVQRVHSDGSVTLDVRKPEARAVVMKFVERVDVVVSNMRPGAMSKLGLAYDDLRTANDQITLEASNHHIRDWQASLLNTRKNSGNVLLSWSRSFLSETLTPEYAFAWEPQDGDSLHQFQLSYDWSDALTLKLGGFTILAEKDTTTFGRFKPLRQVQTQVHVVF